MTGIAEIFMNMPEECPGQSGCSKMCYMYMDIIKNLQQDLLAVKKSEMEAREKYKKALYILKELGEERRMEKDDGTIKDVEWKEVGPEVEA